VFRCTEGLQASTQVARVRRADLEGASSAQRGHGAYGLRPVVEIQFADYFYPASDQIVSEAARLAIARRRLQRPITVRMPCGGASTRADAQPEVRRRSFTHVCGIRTVSRRILTTPKAAVASIENDDPVIFLEPSASTTARSTVTTTGDRGLSKHPLGEVPEATTRCRSTRFGVSRRQRSHGAHLRHDGLRLGSGGQGDWHRRRDHRPAHGSGARPAGDRRLGQEDRPLHLVHEATRTSGFGAELAALVQEHCFYHLEAPIERVTGWDTRIRIRSSGPTFPPARVGAAMQRA